MDPGGVAEGTLLAIGYLLLLVVLLFSFRSAATRIAVLVLGLGLPAGFIAYGVHRNEELAVALEAERERSEAEEAKHLQGLSKYCSIQGLVLHSKPNLTTHEGLRLAFGPNLNARQADFSAEYFARVFKSRKGTCSAPTLAYIEYAAAERVQRVDICPSAIGGPSTPRYSLTLGESGKSDQLPWGVGGNKWVSSASVKLREVASGAVLAEDTLVIKYSSRGDGTCQEPLSQIDRLLQAAFGE